ncbi:MAG: right-handed parallel beta-helix repeat-containing protein, partial [Clostridia bacterium]|nr:right-handed parallel beta-helix repeat-containing protein [Clostridia bacterium]
ATELSYTLSSTKCAAGIMGSCGNVGHSAANCYTTHSKIQGNVSATDSYMVTANCYAKDAIASATPANLGLSYIKDLDGINNGYPVLVWEYEKENPGAVKSTVSVNKSGNGSIDFVPSAITETSIPVYTGQGLGFTVSPSPGSVVTKVNYDGLALTQDVNGKHTFNVEGDGTLTVSFKTPSSNDITIYVSGNGNDANDGSQAAPLKTIPAAILATREALGNKTINIADGEYSAENTIILSDIDDNINFCAYQGGEVIFNGGKNIDKALFSEYSENPNILVADLTSAGITDFGRIKTVGYGAYANVPDAGYNPVVAIDGEYQTLARYPNSGYMSVNSIVSGSTNSENLSFTTSSVNATKWQNEDNLGVFGFFANTWADLSAPATVTANGTISLNTPSYYGADASSSRFYIFNALSELDTAGEYYLDTTNGMLYIYKPENWASVEEISFSAGNNNIVSVNDAVNVTFEGITFENTNATGLRAQNAEGLSVLNSKFKNIGKFGVYVSSSSNATISNNTIENIGVSGIVYNNSGTRDTLTSCNTVISDNDISYVGYTRKAGSYAVDITNTVGVTVSGNIIHNMPHGAILYQTCNDTIMEYNQIYNTNTDVFDSGAFYSGRDWTTRGNIIRYNYIHDLGINPYSSEADVQAIYLDDAHSATTVLYNVFYKVPAVIKIGGGRDNVFRYNLVIDSNYFFKVDERLTRSAFSSGYETIKERYAAVPYTSAAWSKYNHISNIMQDNPTRAKYNNIEYNVRYNCSNYFSHPSDAFLTNGYNNVNNNQTISNTGFFLDYTNGEFSLSSSANSINSTAYNYIKDIPFERMGFSTNIIKVNSFDLTEAGTTLTASANVSNYTGEDNIVMLYIAQYSDDSLVKADIKRIPVSAKAAASDTLVTTKHNDASSVKAFLWDYDLKPLCRAK